MPKLLRLLLSVVILLAMAGPAARHADAQEPPPEPLAAPEAATRTLSIPAAAFTPLDDQVNHENIGSYVKNLTAVTLDFQATVQLPHGATVLSLSLCVNDTSSTSNPSLYLYRLPWTQSPEIMGVAIEDTAGGATIITDTSIHNSVVNNQSYAYFLELHLPPGGAGVVWGCGARITYTPPAVETGIATISGAAFRPMSDGYNVGYPQSPGLIAHRTLPDGTNNNGGYLAQLTLPARATITKLTLHYVDGAPGKTIAAWLQKTLISDATSYYNLAVVNSEDGSYVISTTEIDYPLFDPANFTYWVYLNLPANLGNEMVFVEGVTIEYSLPLTPPEQISLSNAAFTGYHEGYDYENHARWMIHLHGEGGSAGRGVYVAPVYLPDGVVITRLNAAFYDGSAEAGSALLIRTAMGVSETIAVVTSAGNSGYQTSSYAVSGKGVVDNRQYAYFVCWDLPAATLPAPGSGDVVGVSLRVDYAPAQYVYLPMAGN